MLNIDDKPTFTRTVKVAVPAGETSIEQTFKATFEALDVSEVDKFDLATAAGTVAFFQRSIVSLGDIADAGGKALPYTGDLRDRLLDKPWVRGPLWDAYSRGVAKAAEGN